MKTIVLISVLLISLSLKAQDAPDQSEFAPAPVEAAAPAPSAADTASSTTASSMNLDSMEGANVGVPPFQTKGEGEGDVCKDMGMEGNQKFAELNKYTTEEVKKGTK